LIDLALLNDDKNIRELELLYQITTNLLTTEGYGTIRDVGKLITVRRRWWILHFVLEHEVDWELLTQDLLFWSEISMFNEIRELEGSILHSKEPFQQGVVMKFSEIMHQICSKHGSI
jgi:hypothetical protein